LIGQSNMFGRSSAAYAFGGGSDSIASFVISQTLRSTKEVLDIMTTMPAIVLTGGYNLGGVVSVMSAADIAVVKALAEAGRDSGMKYACQGEYEQLRCILIGGDPLGENDSDRFKSDIKTLRKYFVDNGADCPYNTARCIEDTDSDYSIANVKRHLAAFIRGNPSSNWHFSQCVYLTAHGDESGNLSIGNGNIHLDDVLDCMGASCWSGVMLIIVDACYAGSWIKHMAKKCRDGCPRLRRITDNLGSTDWPLHICFRCSSLANEASQFYEGEKGNGSRYTIFYTLHMRKEETDQSGTGFGVKSLVHDKVSGNHVHWGTSTSEVQTDMAADFCFLKSHHTGRRHWKWYFPENRGAYCNLRS